MPTEKTPDQISSTLKRRLENDRESGAKLKPGAIKDYFEDFLALTKKKKEMDPKDVTLIVDYLKKASEFDDFNEQEEQDEWSALFNEASLGRSFRSLLTVITKGFDKEDKLLDALCSMQKRPNFLLFSLQLENFHQICLFKNSKVLSTIISNLVAYGPKHQEKILGKLATKLIDFQQRNDIIKALERLQKEGQPGASEFLNELKNQINLARNESSGSYKSSSSSATSDSSDTASVKTNDSESNTGDNDSPFYFSIKTQKKASKGNTAFSNGVLLLGKPSLNEEDNIHVAEQFSTAFHNINAMMSSYRTSSINRRDELLAWARDNRKGNSAERFQRIAAIMLKDKKSLLWEAFNLEDKKDISDSNKLSAELKTKWISEKSSEQKSKNNNSFTFEDGLNLLKQPSLSDVDIALLSKNLKGIFDNNQDIPQKCNELISNTNNNPAFCKNLAKVFKQEEGLLWDTISLTKEKLPSLLILDSAILPTLISKSREKNFDGEKIKERLCSECTVESHDELYRAGRANEWKTLIDGITLSDWPNFPPNNLYNTGISPQNWKKLVASAKYDQMEQNGGFYRILARLNHKYPNNWFNPIYALYRLFTMTGTNGLDPKYPQAGESNTKPSKKSRISPDNRGSYQPVNESSSSITSTLSEYADKKHVVSFENVMKENKKLDNYVFSSNKKEKQVLMTKISENLDQLFQEALNSSMPPKEKRKFFELLTEANQISDTTLKKAYFSLKEEQRVQILPSLNISQVVSMYLESSNNLAQQDVDRKNIIADAFKVFAHSDTEALGFFEKMHKEINDVLPDNEQQVKAIQLFKAQLHEVNQNNKFRLQLPTELQDQSSKALIESRNARGYK